MVETASKEASQTSGGVSGYGGTEEPEKSTYWSHKASRGAKGTGPVLPPSSHPPQSYLQQCNLVGIYPSLGAQGWGVGCGGWLAPAIEVLDAPSVIWAEAQWVSEGVERGHEGLSCCGVLQTQNMAKFMSCHL